MVWLDEEHTAPPPTAVELVWYLILMPTANVEHWWKTARQTEVPGPLTKTTYSVRQAQHYGCMYVHR